MNIRVITPAPSGSTKGNRVTALRWVRILRGLEFRVQVDQEYDGGPTDLLIALHARRSHDAVVRVRQERPRTPIVVVLTGTDVYQDLTKGPEALHSLELADAIVVLQPRAADELPEGLRAKVRVIYQSALPPTRVEPPRKQVFEVCVIGHLRPVKDPFRAAEAVKLLPPRSRVCITHVGGALDAEMEARARRETETNPGYRWMGERSHSEARRLLGRSRLMALTSVLEGGANAVSEALALGVPIVGSHIPGTVGLLGEDYPGYYPVGDTAALAALLHRAETDSAWYGELRERCLQLQPMVEPERERQAWAELLRELAAPCARAAKPV